ncbi:MAG TPA: hypothetical protein VGA99_04510 [bacterium]
MAHENNIDYDIHGLVGIRLLNAQASDAAAVDRQLGPMRAPLQRDPDIVIRFEKWLATPHLRLLGLDTAGYDANGYYILRSSKAPAKVRIPFDEIGGRCEIVCENGLRSLPLLIAIINLTLLQKDCVPLHASAFVHNHTGILVTGWSKGGKTEAMLAFTANGAEYIGDEWVILSGDGRNMYGLPEPITLWDWHLAYLPQARKIAPKNKMHLFKAIHFLVKMNRFVQKSFLKSFFLTRTFNEGIAALNRQLHVNIPPQLLFGVKGARQAVPGKLFFVGSHQSQEIVVERGDAQEVAERMAASVEYEQTPLLEHYLAYKFAFPDRSNPFIENAAERQYEILSRSLAGKECYTVMHPYPVPLPDLYAAMKPYCETTVRQLPIAETTPRTASRARHKAQAEI